MMNFQLRPSCPLGVSLPLSCQQWRTFHCCELGHCQQCIYQQWHGSILAMTVWHCQNKISVATKLPHWSLLATMWQCGWSLLFSCHEVTGIGHCWQLCGNLDASLPFSCHEVTGIGHCWQLCGNVDASLPFSCHEVAGIGYCWQLCGNGI